MNLFLLPVIFSVYIFCFLVEINQVTAITKIEVNGMREEKCSPTVKSNFSRSNGKCEGKLSFEFEIGKSELSNQRKFTSGDLHYVTDKATGKSIHLPGVFRLEVDISVEEVYNLTFSHVVNGEISEVIVDKSKQDLFCGYKSSQTDEILSFSEGFSCSCGEKVELNNFQYGTRNYDTMGDWESLVSLPLSEESANKRFKPVALAASQTRDMYQKKTQEIEKELHSPTILRDCTDVLQGVGAVYLKFPSVEQRNSFCEQAVHRRRQRQCTKTWQDTVHCLHLSHLWYAVYEMKAPKIEHNITIKFLQKLDNKWKTIHEIVDEQNPHKICNSKSILNYKRLRLLVPQNFSGDVNLTEFPELSGSSHELLVLDNELLNMNGQQCSKAGTSFHAFANQPFRCLAPVGSCIGLQPRELRRKDDMKRKKGVKGSYMLYNFASLPERPLQNTTTQLQLRLQSVMLQPYKKKIFVNLTTNTLGDKLQLYQTLAEAKRSEEVEVMVTQINRLQQDIRVTLRVSGCNTKCTPRTPIRHIILQPLENKTVTFRLQCKTSVSNPVSCNVEALDDITLVTMARREFRVHKGSTCECRGTCRCNCDEKPSPCVALDDTDMHDAGFVPISDSPQYFSFKPYFLTGTVLYLIEILAALSILKAVIGFTCSNSVAIFGFSTLMKRFKPHPIHPFHDLPSRWTLLLMNIHLPLLAIPLFIHWIYHLLRQSCCKDRTLAQSDCEHITVKEKQNWYEMSQLAGVDTSSEEEIDFEEDHSHHRSRTMLTKSERDTLQLRRKSHDSFTSQTVENKTVAHLCCSSAVYRHLDSPLGRVQLPMGTKYCVRGCLRRCENQAYAFNVPSPMYQYWARNESGWIHLPEGIPLKASDFTVFYKSQNKVLEEGEVLLTKIWPCINERK